jgi:hypothetical protein
MTQIDTQFNAFRTGPFWAGSILKSGGWRGHIGDSVRCFQKCAAQSSAAGRIARNPQSPGANLGRIGPDKLAGAAYFPAIAAGLKGMPIGL